MVTAVRLEDSRPVTSLRGRGGHAEAEFYDGGGSTR